MRTSQIIIFALTLTLSLAKVNSAQDILQQICNGIWEQAGLNGPSTYVSCYTGDSAQLTVDFLSNITQVLATGQYVKAPALVYAYKKNLPADVSACVQSNADLANVLNAYGTNNVTLVQLFAKIGKYITPNVQEVHEDFVELDEEFQAGNYDTFGRDYGVLLEDIMGSSSEEYNRFVYSLDFEA